MRGRGRSSRLASRPFWTQPNDDSMRDGALEGERIQELLGQIEALPYPGAKELIHECMEAVALTREVADAIPGPTSQTS